MNNEKIIYSNLIITYIANILENIYIKTKKINNIKIKKNKDKKECVTKINKNNLINGIYNKLLKDIIYGKLEENNIKIFMDTYIILIKNEKDRHFKRISLVPFTKWYVKKYHENCKNEKIIKAIEDNKVNELNKNLKMKSKKRTIIDNIIECV